MSGKYRNGVFGGVEINFNAKTDNVNQNLENNIQNNIVPEKQSMLSKFEGILLKEIKFKK